MFTLNKLPQSVNNKNKRLGRGGGSGRGKTSGRGTKGQRARGKIPARFEGGQLALIKRLPLYRGRGRNKAFLQKSLVINLKRLNNLPENSEVTADTLVKYKVITQSQAKLPLKILGDGVLSKPLIINLPVSGSARKKIIAIGGQVKLNPKNTPVL